MLIDMNRWKTRGQVSAPIEDDTIFALATAPGRAGIAVIRISGTRSNEVLMALAGPLPPPRFMSLRTLRSVTEDGAKIDRALVVRFVESASYTGEDMVELHVHGGRATVARVLDELSGLAGLRMAKPGEFTRRALYNGVLDITQVEGLADLVDAETEMQRRQALSLTEGVFSRLVGEWRDTLISALAHLEAAIEFGEEVDTPDDALAHARPALSSVIAGIETVLKSSTESVRLRDGFVVALIGPPNVGKSSLINVLSNDEAAIVSPIAGTTRDVLRVPMDLEGLPVTFLDMAGIREAKDEIERIGVSRARAAADAADIRVFMSSRDAGDAAGLMERRSGDISVWSKSDLGAGPGDISLSTVDLSGVDDLKARVVERLSTMIEKPGLVAHKRQVDSLRRAQAELDAARSAGLDEICVEYTRSAIRTLTGLVEAVDADDVLDDVFSRFCIGK
ncbi:tRNA uridine-5-carboxymethylaminomethyl(34) synthesis GTPase MnmE [Pikeienuella sp. HZG-20]|uniref:tRNA uridine-5-carboxymethylaminomethyl(34) synthesis GTPase MnmE n=1 Tax=Paludibacillus litoralis TaxID=3133267 RepID=UPI0030EEF672